MKRQILPILALSIAGSLLVGCTAIASTQPSDGTPQSAVAADVTVFEGDLSPEAVIADNADFTTVNDDEWSESDAVDIKLSGSGAAATTEGVARDGSTVTISAAGVYRLSGSLDGQVVIAAPDDALVVLILDGAQINNATGAAIDVQTADDVAISLATGSKNSVSDASSYAEEADANAAIHSSADLTITGSGSLTVAGNGNDGITSTDDLVVLSGSVTVVAADDALRGKDSLVVEGGALNLTATGGDGLKSDHEEDLTKGYVLVTGGTVDITAGDDGVQAQTDTVITGGRITVDAADDGVKGETILSVGGGTITVTESTEAMEAANIGIFDGTIDLTASDDGINASGNASTATTSEQGAAAGALQDPPAGAPSDAAVEMPAGEMPAGEIPAGEFPRGGAGMPGGAGGNEMGGGMANTGERLEISGGTITVDAEGDGLDSNGTLAITGGDTTVHGPTTGGNGALDSNGGITVTGGTLVAFGAGGMEETPGTDSTQGWVMVTGQIAAGAALDIVDAAEDSAAQATARKAAGSVVVSTPKLIPGETYSATAGTAELGDFIAGEAAASQMVGAPTGTNGAPADESKM